MSTRRSTRLPHYDYARTGGYFVTICLRNRTPLLGQVDGDIVRRSAFGDLVASEIHNLQERFAGVSVDLSIVMPDHAHLIVVLGQQGRRLGTIVGSLKAVSAIAINRRCGTKGTPVWQRGYHEHVIRDDADLDRIREYIVTNPVRWTLRRQLALESPAHRPTHGDRTQDMPRVATGDAPPR
jgi:putative transposase